MKYSMIMLLLLSVLSAKESVIFDNFQWQDNKDSKKIKKSWKEANQYCENLVLEGKEDWRLPTVKELQNIVNIRRKKPSIDVVFKFTTHKSYWTSTPYIRDKIKAWSVNFYRGYTRSEVKSNAYYIRCIRNY